MKKFPNDFLCQCSLGYKHIQKAKASSVSTWNLKALTAVDSTEALGALLCFASGPGAVLGWGLAGPTVQAPGATILSWEALRASV